MERVRVERGGRDGESEGGEERGRDGESESGMRWRGVRMEEEALLCISDNKQL